MITVFTIQRSDDWVAARRLETGDNVPISIEVAVNPRELSKDARRVLLDMGHGEYPERVQKFGYRRDYRWATTSLTPYGSLDLAIDSDSPTNIAISEVIVRGGEEVASKRTEFLQEQERIRLADAAKKAEAAAHEEKVSEARELLANELAKLVEAEAKLLTLAEFLHAIPEDAKRGTLKKMAADSAILESMQQQIEDAAPRFVVFEDDDDGE